MRNGLRYDVTRRRRLGRNLLVVSFTVAAALFAAAWLARDPAEQAIRARLESEGRRHGLTVRAEKVGLGVWPLVAVSGLRVDKPGVWSLTTASADLTLAGSLALGRTRLAGPAGLTLDAVPTVWDVVDRHTLRLRQPATGLTVAWSPAPEGPRVDLRASDLPVGTLLTVRRAGVPLLDAGVLGGAAHFATAAGATTFEVDVRSRDVRLAAFSDEAENGPGAAFGEPTAVQWRFSGWWRPAAHILEVSRWRVVTSGAAVSGSLTLADLPGDPRLDLVLEVERVDFARLLEMSALDPPQAVSAKGELRAGDLGSASLTARVSGRVADAASFKVSQQLDFTPPARPLPALERLRGDFVHQVATSGGVKTILVSPDSPDFIAFGDVPPLFVETVLLAEDYGFHGHRGIDLSEVPAAVLKNWSRGGAARGASTITQQLAKNLFLSREKRLGRKLQELSLALLLEATLDKQRILEIYLNVIEWGPGLHGLRPASRRYFGKEPRDLTAKQMAFLVALIPGPIKYQRSFASGTLSPGFRPLVDNLLAKLRSVETLGEQEYQAAVVEELEVLAPSQAADFSTR
jgi:hypothetical protein